MRTIPLVLVAAIVLGGCAKEIDSKKAEKFISDKVAEQAGAKVKSVSCPSGLTAKKGETFECTVTGEDGTSGKAKVTEKDDQGNVSVDAPFIHRDELEQSLSSGISEQSGGVAVDVTCPDIIVVEKGQEFDCQASTNQDKVTVAVTQTDATGHVRYKIKRR